MFNDNIIPEKIGPKPNPRYSKRIADLGEVVRLNHGITNSGLGSGETVYFAEFLDVNGVCVEIPDGAQIKRFLRNYFVEREKNNEHDPDAKFPVSAAQDSFSERVSLLDSKGRERYIGNFPSLAKFRVVSV